MKYVLVLSLLFVAACQGTPQAPNSTAQAVVEKVAAAHPECVRLTVHRVPATGGWMQVVASTLAEKLGKASDPEDHRAIATGETVVLDEAGAVDYSVPVCKQGGEYTAVIGVTLKTGGDPAKQMNVAKAIAAEVAGQID